jgi:hypothetical protein
LKVPLPYLLYRAQTRYEEDLRTIQEIRDALSPTTATSAKPFDEDVEKPAVAIAKAVGRTASSTGRLSGSSRLSTSLGTRTRLTSLGNHSSRKKPSSSSTLTVQGVINAHAVPVRPPSAVSSEEEPDSEDEAAAREEEAERKLEEQEALDRKLEDLQKMMTNDTLGLVSSSRSNGKRKEVDRGRTTVTPSARPPPPPSANVSQPQEPSSRSTSQSVSSTSSPQGSIPDISSPPTGSQAHSPMSRHLSSSKSSSPPAVSPRSAHGLRYTSLVGRDHDSNQGSEASSFSDISGP